MASAPFDLSSLLSTEGSLERLGLIVERVGADIRANVAHIPCHSNGFECGYGGSGPADLALAVLHALIPPPAQADEEKLWELDHSEFIKADEDPRLWSVEVGPDKARVSRLAYGLHQAFKSKFIATMPKEGGFVPIEQIRRFIETEGQQLRDREASR